MFSQALEVIIASKGIEVNSGFLLSEVVNEITHLKNISILSGPCFSDEVAQNLPTAVTFASNNKLSFEKVNSLIKTKNFRNDTEHIYIFVQLLQQLFIMQWI